jgi:hypothetical protein
VDANSRSQAIYQGGTPTNLGVNVNYRLRQFTVNTGNMNDFIALELELTNTGVLDVDGNGTAEKTDNKINALVLNIRNEAIGYMTNNVAGARGTAFSPGRMSGYDGTPDGSGVPWDVPVVFAGADPAQLTTTLSDGRLWGADGSRLIGNTATFRRNYYDIYTGAQWIAAKQGPLPANGSSFSLPDKKTIFDSHPVGTGAQRGWFTSVSRGYGNNDHFPWENHDLSMGTFYEIGGKQFSRTSFKLLPDPNWFDTTTPGIVSGNPLTFIPAVKPEAQRGQPRGDMKYNSKDMGSGYFVQNFEVATTNPLPAPGSASPTAGGNWTTGYSSQHNFDGDHYVGIGPFSLDVGETMNIVMVEYGGFRLQGARKARNAGQWAYENNWTVPSPPPMPDIVVAPNTNLKITVKWDARAEAAADFAGYKVYRSTVFPRVNSLEVGTRLLDTYHKQTTENPTDAQLAALGLPNNPNLSQGTTAATSFTTQEPGAWGPWKLVKNIPKASLGQYLNSDTDNATYKYAFEDNNELVQFGFGYYYYVAAYDNEAGTMNNEAFTSLESHKTNFNGASGLWEGTYFYATGNSFFPNNNNLTGLKNIGAKFILKAPLAKAADLIAGTQKIRVLPNPYKKQALHDAGTEHKMLFINLPTGTKITILDVSGQVIDVLQFGGTNPFDGTLFWDMFSKDGIEVTSGLYVYVAEYPGGKQTGHFAILR